MRQGCEVVWRPCMRHEAWVKLAKWMLSILELKCTIFKQFLLPRHVFFFSARIGGWVVLPIYLWALSFFWTTYGTSCKTLWDANAGESDFKWGSDGDTSPFEECTSQYSGEEQQGSTHNAVRCRRAPPTSSLIVRERSSEVPSAETLQSQHQLDLLPAFSFLLLGRTAIKSSTV